MTQTSTSDSTVGSCRGHDRRRRLVALLTAAALTLIALLTGAAPAAAAEPVGYVTGWGKQDYLKFPASLARTGATAVSAGSAHGLALTPDGKVVGWGSDGYGQTDVPASLDGKTVTAIDAGGHSSLALTSDGKVTAWGLDDRGQTDVPASLNGKTVTAISAGTSTSLALTSDGKVTTWGWNYGLANLPASLDGKTVTAISAGEDSALALTSDGKVIGWGGEYSASHPVVPASLDGKTVTAISAGWHHNLALTSDGTVTVWGYSYELDYADVPASLDSKTVTAVAAGLYQLLALTSDGKVTAWGVNYYGTTTDVPASLDGETFLAVAAGADFSVALTKGRAPVVSASPVSTKVDVGKKTSFTAAATGSPAPAVQWQRADDGEAFADVPGATSTTFAPTAAAADHGARFRAVFTNTFGSATTAAATLSVNRPPSAKSLGVTAGFQSATPVTLSATDPDGDALTYVIGTQPQHGKLSGSAPALTYTPDAGFSGADSFTYRGNDGTLRSATATVSILVTEKPNHAPTATNLKVTTLFESATAIILSGTDPDGDALSYAVVAQPEHGTLSGTAPALMYSPDDGYSGADSFTYRVSDGTASSADRDRQADGDTPALHSRDPKREFTVNVDQRHADGPVRTPKLKVKKPGELLLAFVAADGSTTQAQSVTAVRGGGLTWTLVRRENTARGTSEVWQAYAAKKIRSTRVAVDLAEEGHSVSVTVAGFSRAQTAVGSSAHASGTGSAPEVTLTPRATGSSVWAVGRVVGSRYDPKPVSGQKVVHDRTFRSPKSGHWTQRSRPASEVGTEITVKDKVRALGWGYVAVEIPGACR